MYLMYRRKKYTHSFLILIPLKLEQGQEQRNKSCRMSFAQSSMKTILINLLIFIIYNTVSVKNKLLPDFQSNLL